MRPMPAVAAVAVVLAAAYLLRPRDPAPEPARSATPPSAATEAPAPSLRDTEVDGALAVDAGGRFLPNRDAIRFFDSFLSATGEESAAQIRTRIEAEIARRVPPEAALGAIELLDRYLAFRAEGARVVDDDRVAASADLERRREWIRELRRKHFGAALAETLFGDDERGVAGDPSHAPAERLEWERRLAAYRRDRDAIVANESLDPAAREAAIETLRARDFDARERLRVRTIDEIELGAFPAPAP